MMLQRGTSMEATASTGAADGSRARRSAPGPVSEPVSRLPRTLVLFLLVYETVWLVLAAAWSLLYLARGRQGARILRQRLGLLPRRPAGAPVALWIHAVSVGEMLSTRPLLTALRLRHPDWWVVITVGNQQAMDAARSQPLDADVVCWRPWDIRWCVDTAMTRARPDLLTLVECELWPNLIARAARRSVRLLMMNARIYERDVARYGRARWLFAPLLRRIAFIGAACETERRRFLALGASPQTTVVSGTTKFDAALPAGLAHRLGELRGSLRRRAGPLWVLASTHAGEEEQILSRCAPLRARFPDLQLLIAPRHIARAPAIRRLAQGFGLRTALWSQRMDQTHAASWIRPDAIILDTLGELAALLGLADLVFMGGSLVNAGGHNPIEAALHGRAMVLGPSQHNFRDVLAAFHEADAVETVSDADALLERAAALLADPARRRTLGERAAGVVRRRRGAAATILDAMEAAAPRAAECVGRPVVPAQSDAREEHVECLP
jgi:3-deoxy-D-manno-octulosonic-acid transferase